MPLPSEIARAVEVLKRVYDSSVVSIARGYAEKGYDEADLEEAVNEDFFGWESAHSAPPDNFRILFTGIPFFIAAKGYERESLSGFGPTEKADVAGAVMAADVLEAATNRTRTHSRVKAPSHRSIESATKVLQKYYLSQVQACEAETLGTGTRFAPLWESIGRCVKKLRPTPRIVALGLPGEASWRLHEDLASSPYPRALKVHLGLEPEEFLVNDALAWDDILRADLIADLTQVSSAFRKRLGALRP